MNFPVRSDKVKKKLDQFKGWLLSRGANILESTNEWEVLRFMSGNATCVIYENKKGECSFTGDAIAAWNAYKNNQEWRATQPVKRKRASPIIASLLKRDGDLCFFCLKPMGDDVTVEHLLSITHAGTNHNSNLVLAHKQCNQDADHFSIREKIEIHVKSRINQITIK